MDKILNAFSKRIKEKNPIITVIVKDNKKLDDIANTLYSINQQTYEKISIIVIGKKHEKELKKISTTDKRIKFIESESIEQVLKSNSSDYYTIINSGERIINTYLETNIVSLELNEDYSVSYTDTEDNNSNSWIYYFDSDILYDFTIPVPNIIFRKEVIKDISDDNRTWNLFVNLLKKYKSIHQNYFGIISDIKSNEINEENRELFQKDLVSCQTIDYPFEDYYYEIISSRINKLTVTKKEKKKKNILMIIPWMVIGGADKFNLDFLRLKNEDKYEITILSENPKEYIWRKEFEKYAESVFELPTFLDRRDWPTFLEYIIETRNVDLVIITNSITGYNFIPYIKLKYPHLPVMDYIHCIELYNRYGGYGRDSGMMTSLIDRSLFCSKDAETSCNDLFGISKEKTNTVYIGVDEKKFSPDDKLRETMLDKYQIRDKINIGYICRIDYQKRPYLLFEIMKRTIEKNSNIRFIIGGDGPLLEDIINKTKENEMTNNVLFLGNVTDTKSFYAMCDITINCSIKEGLALTAYESLSMNVPIISADVGGHKELIDEKTGVIVPLLQDETEIRNFNYSDEEINQYVEGIEKIVNNLDYYKNNCRKRILNKFTLDKMVQNMELELDYIIDNPNKKVYDASKKLKEYEKVIYEYINHYLMGSQYEYKTLINRYKKVVYDKFYKEPEEEEPSIREKIERFIKKVHLYSEYILIKDTIKSILKVVLFPLRLIIVEIKKIINIVK